MSKLSPCNLNSAIIRAFIVTVCTVFAHIGFSQYTFENSELLPNVKDINVATKSFEDSLSLLEVVHRNEKILRANGYAACNIDTIIWKEKTAYVEMYVGDQYKIAEIQRDSIEVDFLSQFYQLEKSIINNPYDDNRVDQWLSAITNKLKNTGYPFASITFDSIDIEEGRITGFIGINRSQEITFDTMRIIGKPIISQNYMKFLTDIKPGDAYNETKVIDVNKKIRDVRFLKLRGEPSVSFVEDKAYLNIDLLARNASRFDFLIGVQPSNAATDQSVSIIYDGTIEMVNKLKAGEKFLFTLRSLRPETIEMILKLNYPYLFNLPFGFDLDFNIYRNAESFLELDAQIGWQYLFTPNNYISAYWKFNSSRLLNIDSTAIANLGRLPDQLDVKFNGFGVEWEQAKLDYRFNPRKGYSISNDISIGFKTIIENLSIQDIRTETVDFSTAYDSINTTNFQINLNNKLEYFIPLGKRSTIKMASNAGYILTENAVYRNELFRIGGSHHLRGFDEESIFADLYGIFTSEFRLLIAQNSYISTFVDYGVYRNPYLEDQWDTPIGIGGGLSFETKVGVFGLSTAVGKDKNNDFNFRNAKVHFGFLSLF